jgi:hypothetical protein
VGCDQSERAQVESAYQVVRRWCDGTEAVEPWESDVWNAATYNMSLPYSEIWWSCLAFWYSHNQVSQGRRHPDSI